ncbi:PXMP2/4 family protein 4-like [Impatiens glandulifera]|uniref:PXMP2/4 family protein 4-like n=1 Tax=Impatiens glandulifera TaxID=253017 RepID=UPI001FB1286A|nr:PXMP2/4 family protein 4-like [Impatiens glandulifera]
MNANFLRNGLKRSGYYSIYHNFLYRQSTLKLNGAPITRQQTRAFFKSSNFSIFRKTKDLEWSPPSNRICSLSCSKIGIVGWYLGMINARPVLTKSVTSCLIYAAADLSSQTICETSYDFSRTLRMGMYGLFISGSTLHYWYNFMSRILPKRNTMASLKKMFLGQAVYGPIMTAVFFSTNAALQGESYGEIVARLKRDMIPTLLNGVMYWPLCDFLTFKFIPVHLQPLVSNSFSYLWSIYLTYMASLEKPSLVVTES